MVRLQEPILSIVSQVELSVSAVYTGRVHRAVPSSDVWALTAAEQNSKK